jgi:alpha-galactosidase
MKFGLWYGPDSSNDAANWQRDADRILQLHREHGIDYFKLDSVKAVTANTERNLRRFWDRVGEQSQGKVVFDLDVTAEIRPGYFGAPDVGPVFVENRYTDFHTYWPHHTLRNLWLLSQYVDPLRLRMELLNNTRNQDKYANDPLAPANYQPDHLFASVMCANPLGWFEASNLPDDYIAAVSKLVAVWKRERPSWLAGTMIPIGDAPDGTRWTGFASVAGDRRSAYLLVFRELNGEPSWSATIPLLETANHRLTTLAGNGSSEISGGRVTVTIPKPLDYLWLKISRKD